MCFRASPSSNAFFSESVCAHKPSGLRSEGNPPYRTTDPLPYRLSLVVPSRVRYGRTHFAVALFDLSAIYALQLTVRCMKLRGRGRAFRAGTPRAARRVRRHRRI